MTGRGDRASAGGAPNVRVAIYTRKSVSEGLDQEFNTLDAQREAVEAYVTCQRGEGWVTLEERYDDGGYTGSNTDRPAFQRLLADIEAGKVDTVAVYKIDRLSRSLLDFMKIMEVLEARGVGFTSVTQSFDTCTSTGRMILRLLMTFAEFERETISERTRDKMAASRRRGLWTGGRPVLGYDVVEKRLVVNEPEAEQVRTIFDLYLELGSLLAVVDELKSRKWTNKRWRNKAGSEVGGDHFNKVSLSGLLKNPLYIGKVTADGELHQGVHDPIVSERKWDAVSEKLKSNANCHGGGGTTRRRANSTALLAGIVRCAVCDSAMTSHHTKRGNRRYAYYVCTKHQKEGAAACPGSRVAAGELEQFVVEQIREIGRDPELIEAIVSADKSDRESLRPELTSEARKHEAEMRRLNGERENLVTAIAQGSGDSPGLTSRVAKLEAGIAAAESAASAARNDLQALDSGAVNALELRSTLNELDPVWDALFPAERARLLDLLLERIEFDGGAGDIAITFRPGGPEAVNTGEAQ